MLLYIQRINKHMNANETIDSYKLYVEPYICNNFNEDRWIDRFFNNPSICTVYMKDFIVIKDSKYTKSDPHYLAVVKDTNLRTIRDLRGHHVPLLIMIRNITLSYMQYIGHKDKKINIYVNYLPSCYRLHVHFDTKITYHSYRLEEIVYALRLNSNYFMYSSIPIYDKQVYCKRLNELKKRFRSVA